ncbi:MAG: hypothetical protein KME47_09440 [Nodosilinea sp. WJT8-NPBG4]|jgi:hypothetical protein|nr:hypothetical protein [Nodosilinea sp. WJT8-NPBG4]
MENPNAFHINLKTYTENNFALDYKPAIADGIERWLIMYNTPVIIECSEVNTIFTIYLNSLLADLIHRLGVERSGSMVSFSNLSELNNRVLELSRKHVFNYFNDPKYKEAVDSIQGSVIGVFDDN